MHAAHQACGITPYELGRRANVPATVVRAIEKGSNVPVSQLQAVSNAFGLKIELVEQAEQI